MLHLEQFWKQIFDLVGLEGAFSTNDKIVDIQDKEGGTFGICSEYVWSGSLSKYGHLEANGEKIPHDLACLRLSGILQPQEAEVGLILSLSLSLFLS